MGRQIDETRPFTEDEKDWLRTRGTAGEMLIQVNERKFKDLSQADVEAAIEQSEAEKAEEATRLAEARAAQQAAEEDSFHPEDIAEVEGLTTAQLRERLSKENKRNSVTEKDKEKFPEMSDQEILAYRLLDYLDSKRK